MSDLTTSINVQIDKSDKEQAMKILQKLGVSMSGLINMTIKQLIMREKIPFDVAIPKKSGELYQFFDDDQLDRTAKEIEYIEKHPSEYKTYDNLNDLKKDLINDK